MNSRLPIILLALVALLGGAATVIASPEAEEEEPSFRLPGQPRVEVLTPRNGSRHVNRSVVVRVNTENFTLAPNRIGLQPRLGEGHIKFSLNRVPDCVDPEEVREAELDPRGSGRLTGRSFDFPEFSGVNGLLAERTGSLGSYSPATEPQILYAGLPRGFYRLVITLARNDGTSTPAHAVTTFEILSESKQGQESRCEPGQVAAQDAAASLD